MLGRSSVSREWRVVLHFLGVSRDCFRLKDDQGNFYAILALADKSLRYHVSYHASGERHFKVSAKGTKPIRYYPAICQPTSVLRGFELLFQTPPIYRGQLQRFRIYKPSKDPAIILDADEARFRDDDIFLRVYLMEPNSELRIPEDLRLEPPWVHIIRETRPWVRIEFFQQKWLGSIGNGSVNSHYDQERCRRQGDTRASLVLAPTPCPGGPS
jgi:hypothetical protein